MLRRQVRNRLKALIKERQRKLGRRIKQKDLAECIGVSEHTLISWIRNDVQKYDRRTLGYICDYFDCQIGDLLYFEWVKVDDPPDSTE